MNIVYWRCYYAGRIIYYRMVYHLGTYPSNRFFGEGSDWYECVVPDEVPYVNKTIFIL